MHSGRLVLDASTAILLAKTGLLRQVVAGREAWIGEKAASEALAKESEDARAIAALLEEGSIKQQSPARDLKGLMKDFRLNAGEAEAILLAQEQEALCATDDGPAIRCCKVLGIPFTTAIGFLVALSESDEVEVELGLELLTKLERFGRYHARILEDAGRRIRAVANRGEQS